MGGRLRPDSVREDVSEEFSEFVGEVADQIAEAIAEHRVEVGAGDKLMPFGGASGTLLGTLPSRPPRLVEAVDGTILGHGRLVDDHPDPLNDEPYEHET